MNLRSRSKLPAQKGCDLVSRRRDERCGFKLDQFKTKLGAADCRKVSAIEKIFFSDGLQRAVMETQPQFRRVQAAAGRSPSSAAKSRSMMGASSVRVRAMWS